MKKFDEQDWLAGYLRYGAREFAGFRADFKDFGDIQALDWRDAGGRPNYHVRYVFDTRQCQMYVSGDLGSAVFWLTWEPTFENMWWRRSQIGYITEKISCSTDKYEWPRGSVEQDIREYYADDRPERGDFPEGEDGDADYSVAVDDFDSLLDDFACCFDERRGPEITEDVEERLSGLDPDWWEHSFGRVIAPRVHLWFLGLEMAWEQLHGEGKEKTKEKGEGKDEGK